MFGCFTVIIFVVLGIAAIVMGAMVLARGEIKLRSGGQLKGGWARLLGSFAILIGLATIWFTVVVFPDLLEKRSRVLEIEFLRRPASR